MSFSTRTIALRVWRVKCTGGSFTVDWSIDAQQVTQTTRGVFLEEITVHWRNVWTGWRRGGRVGAAEAIILYRIIYPLHWIMPSWRQSLTCLYASSLLR